MTTTSTFTVSDQSLQDTAERLHMPVDGVIELCRRGLLQVHGGQIDQRAIAQGLKSNSFLLACNRVRRESTLAALDEIKRAEQLEARKVDLYNKIAELKKRMAETGVDCRDELLAIHAQFAELNNQHEVDTNEQ